MKKTEKKDLRTKAIVELRKIVVNKRKEFGKIRLEKGAAKIKNIHLLALKRREIATILTIIAEKEFEGSVQK